MDSKTIILVIILAVFVGIGIFFGQRMMAGNGSVQNPFRTGSNVSADKTQKTPEPKPAPTYPPLDSNSNLEEETEKLDPPDFSNEYKTLKDEVSKQ